jgi:hypothetical protein
MLNEVYEYVLGSLQKSARDVFRERNMISMTEQVFAEKKGVSSADFPELQMGLVQLIGPLTKTSSHANLILIYDVRIASGEMTMTLMHELLWWLITRIKWLNDNRGIFDYKETKPITSITFGDASVGLSNDVVTRNIIGFSSIAKIRIELSVPHVLITPVDCDNV